MQQEWLQKKEEKKKNIFQETNLHLSSPLSLVSIKKLIFIVYEML